MIDYVPLLKGKEGEFAALEALNDDVRHRIMPLIEVPGIPYDYANDRPGRSLDDHVASVAARLQKCWPGAPLYLDLPWFGGESTLADGREALARVLDNCTERAVQAVPVVSVRSSEPYVEAAGRYCLGDSAALCVRLSTRDFEDEVDTLAEVSRLLDVSGVPNDRADLILDFGDIGGDTQQAVLAARAVLGMIPFRDRWRRVVVAAASFPEDLSEVSAESVSLLERREWRLWTTLMRRPTLLPRSDVVFGDYAISHPVQKELDPRTMRMSASIRYTTPESWLVAKGRNVRQYGFEQYFELSRTLVERREFCGPNFSWGDGYIASCAAGELGPGNATTWRKVGTNHHLTLVARQLSSRSVAS